MGSEEKIEEFEVIASQIFNLLNSISKSSQDSNWEVRYQVIEFIKYSGILDFLKIINNICYFICV